MATTLNGQLWQMVFSTTFAGFEAYQRLEFLHAFSAGNFLVIAQEQVNSGLILAGYLQFDGILNQNFEGGTAQKGENLKMLLNRYHNFEMDESFRLTLYPRRGVGDLSVQVWEAV